MSRGFLDDRNRSERQRPKIIGIYRAAKEDTWVIEKLADRTGYMGNITKRSVIGDDINLAYAF